MNSGGDSDKPAGIWGIKVRPDRAKLTNMIIAGFEARLNLAWKGELFIQDEAKIASRLDGVEWVAYFGRLFFESNKQEFSPKGVKSSKICSYPGINVLKSILKACSAWFKVGWTGGWKEKKSVIWIKLVV